VLFIGALHWSTYHLKYCKTDSGSLLVSGRLLKVYAPDSPALAFLYRTDHPLSKKCSGWGAVHSHDVENFEVSTHVPQGAHAYHFAVPAVIEEVALLPCN